MKKILPLLLSLLLLLSGCAAEAVSRGGEAAPAAPRPLPAPEFTYSVAELAFTPSISLQPGQRIDMLDADAAQALFIVRERLSSADGRQELSYATPLLCLYRFADAALAASWTIPDGTLVQSGALAGDTVFYCQTTQSGATVEYQIMAVQEGEPLCLDRGSYDDGFTLPPRFATLDDGTLLYCFQQKAGGRIDFGLKMITPDLRVTPLLAKEQTATDAPLNGKLASNGKAYLYFLRENDQGVFYIGDQSGVQGRIALQRNEKLLDCALLAEGGIFQLSVDEDTPAWRRETAYLDLQGEPIATDQPHLLANHSLHRMTSDGANMLLAVDGHYHIYALSARPGELRLEILRPNDAFPAGLAGEAVLFYPLGQAKFLLYYQTQMRFLTLEVHAGD